MSSLLVLISNSVKVPNAEEIHNSMTIIIAYYRTGKVHEHEKFKSIWSGSFFHILKEILFMKFSVMNLFFRLYIYLQSVYSHVLLELVTTPQSYYMLQS